MNVSGINVPPLCGVTLRLSPDQLSDLFFAFSHPAYDYLCERYEDTDEKKLIAACVSDAREFCDLLGISYSHAFPLAAYFISRL